MAVMSDSGEDITVEIESEVGTLISQLHEAGWLVSASRYDAKTFGNWYVDLHRADHVIRIVRDRSRYLMDGSHIQEIKAAGLWRAFDDLEEFSRAVGKWITNLDATLSGTRSLNSI